MNRRIFLPAFLLLMGTTLALSACTKTDGVTEGLSHSISSSSLTSSEADTAYSMKNLYSPEEDGIFQQLQAQFINDTPDAYLLSEAIMKLRDARREIPLRQNFENLDNADFHTLIDIAAAQSPTIDPLHTDMQKLPQNDPVRKLYTTMQGKQTAITYIVKKSDLQKTYKQLFNRDLPEGESGVHYQLDKDSGLYYSSDAPVDDPWTYPVVVTYEQDGNIWTVEAVTMNVWMLENRWSSPDGQWMSDEAPDREVVAEFVRSSTTDLPTYRFTFEEQPDGHLVLTSSEYLYLEPAPPAEPDAEPSQSESEAEKTE